MFGTCAINHILSLDKFSMLISLCLMKVKRIAVIGSRTAHIDAEALAAYIFSDAIIISGGAKGADTIAETFAISHNLPITIYKPDYKKHGKAAPLIRNRMIIDKCDLGFFLTVHFINSLCLLRRHKNTAPKSVKENLPVL